jgi:outer membrane receptor protein involved in Fe transport
MRIAPLLVHWLALGLTLLAEPAAAEKPSPSSPPSPPPLKGEAIGGEDRSETEILRITSSRRAVTKIMGASSPITLDRREFENSIPEVLTDALGEIPSVHVQTTTTGQGSPFIRGLTGSGILNLVDGMRLNNALYRSAPTPYLALVDPALVDRIEVIRGPASVRHGSDAMGGVVRVLTRKPRFESENWNHRAALSGFFNSADLGRGIRAEIESGKTEFGIRAGFSALETDDRRAGGDVGYQVPTSFRAFSSDFALLWEPDKNQRIELDLQFNRQPESPRYDEMVVGYGQTLPSSSEFYYQPLERLFAHLQYEIQDPVTDWDDLRLDVSFQRIRDGRRTRDYQVPTRVRERNQSQLIGFSAMAQRQIFEMIDLSLGADAYLDRVSSSRWEIDIHSGNRQQVKARFPDGSEMNSYGGHADLAVSLFPWLSLDTGIRYSFFETCIAATSTTATERIETGDLTGALGLTMELGPDLSLLLHFRRGFRAPNIFDLGTLGPRPGNRFNLPASDVDPEIIYTTDLAIHYAGEKWEVELTGFYSRYEDKIESVLTGAVTADNRDIIQSANAKEVQLAGVEGFGSFRLRDELSLLYSLFWVWGEQSLPAGGFEAADRIPPFQGRIGFSWQPRKNLVLEPYLRFAASQRRLSARDIRDPRIDPRGTDGWATLNIRGYWRWNDRVTLSAELFNMTDANYREHGSGIQAEGAGIGFSMRVEY